MVHRVSKWATNNLKYDRVLTKFSCKSFSGDLVTNISVDTVQYQINQDQWDEDAVPNGP